MPKQRKRRPHSLRLASARPARPSGSVAPKPLGAAHPKAPLHEAHAIGNPLAVAPPLKSAPPATARRLRILQAWQQRMWSWAVALAIVLFFVLSAIELLPLFGLLPPASPRTAELLEGADLLAILVVGLELFGQYQKTSNKWDFLRHNWLSILALLPVGMLIRGLRAFEALGAMRTVQAAGKLEELSVVLPGLNLGAVQEAGAGLLRAGSALALRAQTALTHFSVITDFIELVLESAGRLWR